MKRDYILIWLKDNLSEKRYLHTLGVEEMAVKLAKKYNLDTKKASIAGLLHDSAKCLDTDELKRIITEEIKNVPDYELLNYKTYHAPVGEYFAKEKFGVTDREILSSIRWHTLGKVNMTPFEMIIFLADKIEANTRDKEYREFILKILDEYEGIKGLKMALFVCFSETIKSLVKRKLAICNVTIEVYNWLLQEI